MFTSGTLLDGIRRWVEIETPTDVPEAVNRLVDLVQAEAATFGAPPERVTGSSGYGDHLLVRSPWGQNDPGILILSHLDTVHPIGFLDRLPFKVEGDVAFGPGIYDMKAGAYLAFAALGELIRSRRETPLGITHLLVSDEELGSPSSRALIEAEGRRAKYVLVTEPAREGGKIVTARKGVGRFEMHITGQAAHAGSRHQDGRSAVRELARQILVLEGLTDYEREITVNVGVIAGGTRENVVAEEASALIDLRIPTVAAADEMMNTILGLKAHEDGVTVKVSGGLNRPPYEKDERVTALFAHARRVAAEIGFELHDMKSGGGSDGNFTAPFAATLDGLGADGKGAHTSFEQIYISSLEPRAHLMHRLLQTLS